MEEQAQDVDWEGRAQARCHLREVGERQVEKKVEELGKEVGDEWDGWKHELLDERLP